MQLVRYRDTAPNFGDDLNDWLWPRVFPRMLDGVGPLFIGIGTLLDSRIPSAGRKVVFGAGAGYGSAPVIDDQWLVYFVRGPLTAQLLGLSEDAAITDGAALVAHFAASASTGAGSAAFLPHFESPVRASAIGVDFAAATAQAGLSYLDPSSSVDTVIEQIRSSALLLTEAMHGAIVADALRVPWIAVTCLDHVLEFKWRDWCASLELLYEPVRCDASATDLLARDLARATECAPTSSSDRAFDRALTRIDEEVDRLRSDWNAGRLDDQGDASFSLGVSNASWWWEQVAASRADIASVLPSASMFLVANDEQWDVGAVNGGTAVPLSTPGGADEAIDALERGRATGATALVVLWPSFWIIDGLAPVASYLETQAECLFRNERVAIFTLDPQTPDTPTDRR